MSPDGGSSGADPQENSLNAGVPTPPPLTATPEPPPKVSLIRRLMRSRRDFERTIQVVRRASRFVLQSSLPRMAAALSYRTIFGLIPTLVIGVAVLGSFASKESMEGTVRQLLVYTGISEIVIDEEVSRQAELTANIRLPSLFGSGLKTPRETSIRPDLEQSAISGPPTGTAGTTTPPAPSGTSGGSGTGAGTANPATPGAARPTTEVGLTDVTLTTPGLEDWISTMVTRVRAISFSAIGAIGVLTLIYAAISMLIEIERAFNDIFKAPTGRPWGRRVQLYWTMLTLGIILILATFFMGAQATAWLAGLHPSLGPGKGLGALLTFIATVLTSTVLLGAVYLWVPNTRVQFKSAVAGAFVGALLWETSKLGLQRYIELSTSYAKLYGSLGLLPLLLIWIYVTWLIVLFGLQVAYALQHFHTWRAEDEARDATPPVVEPGAILAVAGQVAKGFAGGKATRIADLGTLTGLDDRVARLMVDRLATAGVLMRVEHADDAVTLGRPPESLGMAELLRLGFEMSGEAPGVAGELREATIKALEGRTLASGVAASSAANPAGQPANNPASNGRSPGGAEVRNADSASPSQSSARSSDRP